jgi:transmembrane sensor
VTGPSTINDSARLQEEALDWVVRLKAGEPTRADVDALMAWRRQSTAHEDAFKSAARLLRDVSIAADEMSEEQTISRHFRAIPAKLTRRALFGGAAAAAAASYLVVEPPLGLWPSLKELSADYRTGKGEQRKIALDSSVFLELNTQTSIAIHRADNGPNIELISGEASVSAKLPQSRSLTLMTGGGRIVVQEANFNALCLESTVSVTCLTGALQVEHGSQSIQLAQAQQTSFSAMGLQPRPIAVNPGEVTAWQTGELIFRNRPLASVVDEVNRYRPGKIVITSNELKTRLVNGTFQLSKLGNFVAQVEQLFGANATSLPGGIVLLG